MDVRRTQVQKARDLDFDIAVIGGGINGACLYDRLCREGYATVLLDRADFAAGSSQGSGMMIWGGLLYLKNFDLMAVARFSRARDRIIRQMHDWVEPKVFRFLPAEHGLLSRWPTLAALYLYWAMSLFERRRPRLEPACPSLDLSQRERGLLAFEEGLVSPSDARFVLQWITPHREAWSAAINYAQVQGGGFSPADRLWHLELVDRLCGDEFEVRARSVVNCAGVWTDAVNRLFSMVSPNRHILSKGVYLLLGREPERERALVLPMKGEADVLTSVPWGPVEMWGPTEEVVSEPAEGFHVVPGGLEFLLEQRRALFSRPIERSEVVGVRAGVRPLAVDADYYGDEYPLSHSRSIRISEVPDAHWITVHGGKLTGCVEAARKVESRIRRHVSPSAAPGRRSSCSASQPPKGECVRFPGLGQPLAPPAWCAEHEQCVNLEGYLRRRTNIGQWIRRCGLGADGENRVALREISLALHGGDERAADADLERYLRDTVTPYDELLQRTTF